MEKAFDQRGPIYKNNLQTIDTGAVTKRCQWAVLNFD
jgi:hypothetical protein